MCSKNNKILFSLFYRLNCNSVYKYAIPVNDIQCL